MFVKTSGFRFTDHNHEANKYSDEDIITVTSIEQKNVEKSVSHCFESVKRRLILDENPPILQRDLHHHFLWKGLRGLSESYQCLDASRPWLCYWILHSLSLLDEDIPDEVSSQIAKFLASCQCSSGGFAGGPGQFAHLAPTYAAVNALCILGTEEAYKVINRQTLESFLLKMKSPCGGFKMHEGGELDIRGAYCALSAAKLTNVATPKMFDGTAEWIVSCQTYEGGFGGYPGMEAHGGYSFCGIAALVLLGRTRLCDIKNLLRWTSNRQMKFEGGFQGRTNKLVDGCYSFWQGGAFPLIHRILSMDDDSCLSSAAWLMHQQALQEYVLVCCQHPGGGLIDKPGKARDFYHTCYCLSGLSIAQHFFGGEASCINVLGHPKNELIITHPVYNIAVGKVIQANSYFDRLPLPDENT